MLGTALCEYDANGALTKSDDGATEKAYTYDYDGYLTAFDTTGTENDATYTYDAGKRRIAKVVDSVTTKYFLDGSNVIADFDGDDVLQATYVTPGLDANLSQTRSGSTYYYMADGLGSIRNVVDTNEDTQNIYDYYAFGKELGSWTQNVTNRYTYTAREYDTESEQYYYRARYYDGGGRFNRRDSSPPYTYLYGQNTPTIYSDPSGRTVVIKVDGDPTHVAEATLKGLPARLGGGKTYTVPFYEVWMHSTATNAAPLMLVYAVTRDTAFDNGLIGDRTPKERCGKYTTNHEAPPGEYSGRIYYSGNLKEEVILISDKEGGVSIKTSGGDTRTYIEIHRGPGYSEGCLLGQRGSKGQAYFIKKVKEYIKQDEAACGDGKIRVILQDRSCDDVKE